MVDQWRLWDVYCHGPSAGKTPWPWRTLSPVVRESHWRRSSTEPLFGSKKKKPTFDLFWYVRSDLGVTMPDKRRLASSSHDIVNMRPPKQRSFSSANSTHGQPRPSSDPSCRIEHLHAWLGSLHALRSCRPRERMRLKHLLREADDMLMRRSAGRDLG